MAKITPTVSERSFYPALLEVIEKHGGSGVQEIQYNSVPDILFRYLRRDWLLSVKIGESPALMKDAFLQYLRHKDESGISDGLLLIFPESVRSTKPTELALSTVVQKEHVTVLVDAGPVKDEFRDRPFPEILSLLKREVAPLIEKSLEKHYPLPLVISLLRAQVIELMSELALGEEDLLHIVTDRKLLTDLGSLNKKEAEAVGRFLAAYIILSQILFLRLFAVVHPSIVTGKGMMTQSRLRKAFKKILEINYRPIYEIDVLDAIGEKYLVDTFDLIWGLEIERIRYELPGRIFHELMPPHIRKLLAAFYTRPQAADLLARLTIECGNNTILDPACGSGTILVSAYRAKKRLHDQGCEVGNPHRRYCEDEIFGADIMPFAVHLTSANLAAMDVAETIQRTLLIQGDSIDLVPGTVHEGQLQLSMLGSRTGKATSGHDYEVPLNNVDVVLMNPPFTKVERGIRHYVNMERFKRVAGGEVGLWGHFIFLADQFLRNNGLYGAVIPINILRGRESTKSRKFLFNEWTPLYILKPTLNYGFSEWSEYRDVLFIARKHPPPIDHQVKFGLVKKDLTTLTEADIEFININVKGQSRLRSSVLDLDTHALADIKPRFSNLMWFCGVSNLSHRDTITDFIGKFAGKLERFPNDYFREGYRPVPKGVSGFMFLTRASGDARIQQAFLKFREDRGHTITATSHLGVDYTIEKTQLLPSLRTPVGLRSMDITDSFDYVAKGPYRQLDRVISACGFKEKGLDWNEFWDNVRRELTEITSHIMVIRRINPYSPNMHLNAFISTIPLASSNQVNVIVESNVSRARAVCCLLNSCLFFAYFFLLKEESTGRYLDIRFYDLYEMHLYPRNNLVADLESLFMRYSLNSFPSLRDQFDKQFDERYEEFWQRARDKAPQQKLWSVLDKPIEPDSVRLEFDIAICKVLGVKIAKQDLIALYSTIVKEMIITRGLIKD